MALINRMQKMLQADIHALLDRIEDPELLLRQALRDMEESCTDDERRLQLLTRERTQCDKRRQALDHTLETIEAQLDRCFTLGEEDLARAQVKRKLETRQLLRLLVLQIEELDETREETRARLAQNRERLEEIRRQGELLIARKDLGESSLPADRQIGDDDLELAFLQEKQKRTQQ